MVGLLTELAVIPYPYGGTVLLEVLIIIPLSVQRYNTTQDIPMIRDQVSAGIPGTSIQGWLRYHQSDKSLVFDFVCEKYVK